MFERYTQPARRALFFSRYEASQLGSLAIEPEHILLGVARTGEPLTDGILSRARLSTEEISRQIHARTGRDVAEAPVPKPVEIPFSATAKRVLEGAAEESDRLLHGHIGPEHLLLGLLRQEHGVASAILETNGLTLASVRDEIVMQLSATLPPPRDIVRMFSSVGLQRGNQMRVTKRARIPNEAPVTSSTIRSVSGDGFSLRRLIAWAYREDELHIDMPADLDIDEVRYDVRLDLTGGETWPAIDRLLQTGIERHFNIRVTRETRAVDVYVMSAHDGPSRGRRTQRSGAGFAASIASFSRVDSSVVSLARGGLGLAGDAPRLGLHSIGPISMSGTTISELGHVLEEFLGRPVIDETGLVESCDIDLQGEYTWSDALVSALRDQLGLVLTAGQRDQTMVIVRRETLDGPIVRAEG